MPGQLSLCSQKVTKERTDGLYGKSLVAQVACCVLKAQHQRLSARRILQSAGNVICDITAAYPKWVSNCFLLSIQKENAGMYPQRLLTGVPESGGDGEVWHTRGDGGKASLPFLEHFRSQLAGGIISSMGKHM